MFSLLLPFVALLLYLSPINASKTSPSDALAQLKLSQDARIHLRNDPGYANATKRWQYWNAPDFAAVVEVATPNDVAEVVRFANSHGIDFLAQSGLHGGMGSLGALRNGISIDMRRLNSFTLAPDGTYITVGGGIKGFNVRDALWKHGKWTVHGVCECPGHTALALGGGLGLLQGRYGLLSDQVLSLDVVLADGSAITVSSTSHPDLFWAMQGAGHNFGIVTSLDYRVYDIPDQEIGGKVWSQELLIYEATAENVKAVNGISKRLLDEGKQPDGLMLYGMVAINPAVGEKPVLMQTVAYNGPLTSIRAFTEAYHALSPISVVSNEGTYLDHSRWFQADKDSISCNPSQVIPNPAFARFPVDMTTYDLDALADAVEAFLTLVLSKPEFGASFFMIEQYPAGAVKNVDAKKSVVPWRNHGILISPALIYSVDNTNNELGDFARESGEKVRRILIKGTEKTGGYYAYVNYAFGNENVEEIYGKENVKNLRSLKKTYDPQNRFRFYGPIEASHNEPETKTEL